MPIRQRRIFLEDLAVPVSIGIHDFEQNRTQTILVNVELFVRDTGSPTEDRKDPALNYDFLREGIRALVANRHFNLQETLCEAILDLCRKQPGLERVVVSTRKTEVYSDCKSVGFEIVYDAD